MRNYLKSGTIIITLTLFGCWLFSVEKHHMQLPIDSYVLVTGLLKSFTNIKWDLETRK